MAGVVRVLTRSSLLRQTSALVQRRSTMATKKMTAYEEMNQFWVKNYQLKRPLSPHLSIYGYHTTMIVSITNRVLAVALQGVFVGGSCLMLVLPTDYASVLKWIKELNVGPALIVSLKYILAIPFVYHTLAGIRHLVWDAGKGYKNNTVLQGSYAIVLATIMLATAMVFGIKPSAM